MEGRHLPTPCRWSGGSLAPARDSDCQTLQGLPRSLLPCEAHALLDAYADNRRIIRSWPTDWRGKNGRELRWEARETLHLPVVGAGHEQRHAAGAVAGQQQMKSKDMLTPC